LLKKLKKWLKTANKNQNDCCTTVGVR